MAALYHPFDRDHLYEVTENGTILVTAGERKGLFTDQGIYISGELRHADPQVCVWVGNNPDPATQLSKPRVAGREI
ncbi:MAG: hypothetical protein ACJAVI_002702 [Candidatus Azotimanducaceae bacterium]|jgi:hypothetical protein